MEPLAQVLYHGNWLSGKERSDIYTSLVRIPVRHAKMLVVSSQTQKEKKKRELKICGLW